MSTVADFLGKRQAKSRYPKYQLPLASTLCGVELEIDNPNNNEGVVYPTCVAPVWKQTHDGSLNNGYEYVLNAPLAGKQLTNAIYQLFDHGTKTTRTFTGSTHIHVNVIDGMRMQQLKTLVLLCYYFEDMLYGVGDYSRKWCGFANPMATIPVNTMKDIFALNDLRSLRDALDATGRYYGLNLRAMDKYGSVEFRYFPTATSAEELLYWLKLVQLFKKAALETGTPKKLVALLSSEEGVAQFMEKYFSEYKKYWHYAGSFYDIQKRVYKSMIITEAADKPVVNVRYSKKFDETRYGRLLKQPKVKKINGTLPFGIHLTDSWESSITHREGAGVSEFDNVLVINRHSTVMGFVLHTRGYLNDLDGCQAEGVNVIRDNIEVIRAWLDAQSVNSDFNWLARFDLAWDNTYKAYLDTVSEPQYDEDESEGEW